MNKLPGKSMFAFLKRKDTYCLAAQVAYAACLQRARDPVFYCVYGVPDTFDGRFDLLLLHLFLVIDCLKGEGCAGNDFNQALFDVCFANMDQTLREMGIGDMGVPKHMRRMMKAFNGRMNAYAQAFDSENPQALEFSLQRNVYAVSGERPVRGLPELTCYARRCKAALAEQKEALLRGGEIVFERVMS